MPRLRLDNFILAPIQSGTHSSMLLKSNSNKYSKILFGNKMYFSKLQRRNMTFSQR